MTKHTTKPTTDIPYKPKKRDCLMCGDGFDSEWSGERVCKRCKSNDGWRNGNAVHAA
ncbi:MAG: hypothetical protein V3R85_03675 [Alphaproteobacteria bacterium]